MDRVQDIINAYDRIAACSKEIDFAIRKVCDADYLPLADRRKLRAEIPHDFLTCAAFFKERIDQVLSQFESTMTAARFAINR